MRRIVILGSTGSIGMQALEVVAASEELEVTGLSAGGDAGRIVAQAAEHRVRRVALRDPEAAARAAAAGLDVVMDRCMKIEHGRYFGEMHWFGLNTGLVTSRRPPRTRSVGA